MLYPFRSLHEHFRPSFPCSLPARQKAAKLCIPAALASCVAPIFEKIGQLRGERPFFTPYSIAVLRSNGHFSNAKATAALGFHARPLKETLRSMILWFQGQDLISPAL